MRFKKSTRSIATIVAAQAACLALGLWLHHRFVVSVAEWNASRHAEEKLDLAAGRAVFNLRRHFADGDIDIDATTTLIEELPLPEGSSALLVDARWHVIAARKPDAPTRGFEWVGGQPVAWRAKHLPADDPLLPIRGELHTPVGLRPATAYRLPRGAGHALFYRADDRAPLTAAALLGSLPMASLISLVWVAGLQAVLAYLVLSQIFQEQSRRQTKLDEETLRRTKDLVRTRDAVIFGLAKLAESRDPETGHHLERISLYSMRLATALRRYSRYRDVITPEFVKLIGISSALHDVGKVGIRDAILLKPGRLTDEERAHMQTHTTIGGDCLKKIEQRLGTSNFLEMAREIALAHHERWDGNGYPCQIDGEQIPLAARIVAIADVYDALASRRVYKDAFPHEKCVRLIEEGAGTQFDPDLVEVFLQIQDQFRDIGRQYASEPALSAIAEVSGVEERIVPADDGGTTPAEAVGATPN